MGAVGFAVGAIAGQVSGAWCYWRVRHKGLGGYKSEALAATCAGFVTALVATAVYSLFRVHTWIAGPGSSWGASAFLGLCTGIAQGVMFRGRPLSAFQRNSKDGENDSRLEG